MLSGSCHCGKIAYTVDAEIEGPVLECNCSHCSRKGYLLWFVPQEKLTLKTPRQALAVYHFNKHVIDHHFCPDCGCAPFGFGTSPTGEATAAINVRCLEDVDLTKLERVAYDGRAS